MIARHWKGWTTIANAHLYEEYWTQHLLPELNLIAGFRGAHVLRRNVDDSEVEFITITMWESMDAIKSFAGEDYNVAVISPTAKKVLSRYETIAYHYDVFISPYKN